MVAKAFNLPIWRESRMGLELAALLRNPVLRGHGVADGRGQPVLLLPGLLAGDDSLRIMGRWLKGTGHHPARAGIRMNVNCSGVALERLEDRLEAIVEARGMRAAVIGHSRGGSFAKVLAHRRPDLVSGVITLGCPHIDTFAVHPLVRAQIETLAALGKLGLPGLFSRACLEGDCCEHFWEAARSPLRRGVGYVSVYSRIVPRPPRRACRGGQHALRHGGPSRCLPDRGRLARRVPPSRLEAPPARRGGRHRDAHPPRRLTLPSTPSATMR
jgi:triacylglycerol lipase